MAVGKFRELREGIITLLSQQAGKAFEGAPTEDNPFLKDLDTLAIAIDGVPVMLTYHEPVKEDRAFVFTNFGAIPPELELAAMRRLMEINFMLYQGNAPAFTRDTGIRSRDAPERDSTGSRHAGSRPVVHASGVRPGARMAQGLFHRRRGRDERGQLRQIRLKGVQNALRFQNFQCFPSILVL